IAGCELERSQASVELEASIRLVILLGIPESTVVRGIDRHAAVISPAVETVLLNPTTCDDQFGGLHRSFGIGGNTANIFNGGLNRGTGLAVAQGDVAILVHGDAAHKLGHCARATAYCSLLENGRGGTGVTYFIP